MLTASPYWAGMAWHVEVADGPPPQHLAPRLGLPLLSVLLSLRTVHG